MNNWICLSKNGEDQYINMFALATGCRVVKTDDFVYSDSTDPIIMRGILKYKIMKECWEDERNFYYMDTGYFGNQPNSKNPYGWKLYHRIVKNNLQHGEIISRPSDRWEKLKLSINNWKKGGKNIIIAAPDEKPCKFYGIDKDQWIADTVETLKKYTDRPIIVRDRAKSRIDRVVHNTLKQALDADVHALVTFNSVAATEAVLYGYPAFTLAPCNAASPVASRDLSQIETPYYADSDKLYAWACHLAYGQFHVNEIRDGSVIKILEEQL
jgi:hypothetical protein